MANASSPGSSDPWRQVRLDTDRHRVEHGCWAYPHADGRLLGVLAAAVGAKRILELGTALGYTALWLASGLPSAHVDTLERDPEHVVLARRAIAQAGFEMRITVHEGEFAASMPSLRAGYDLAFFDGYAPALPDLLALETLLRPGGLLISANQQLSGNGSSEYRSRILDPAEWFSAPLGGNSDMTLSVRMATASSAEETR